MFNIGDRVNDGGFKGTVVQIVSEARTRVLYDEGMEVTVHNSFLEKIELAKATAKFPKITYWE